MSGLCQNCWRSIFLIFNLPGGSLAAQEGSQALVDQQLSPKGKLGTHTSGNWAHAYVWSQKESDSNLPPQPQEDREPSDFIKTKTLFSLFPSLFIIDSPPSPNSDSKDQCDIKWKGLWCVYTQASKVELISSVHITRHNRIWQYLWDTLHTENLPYTPTLEIPCARHHLTCLPNSMSASYCLPSPCVGGSATQKAHNYFINIHQWAY